jgi:Fur family ferric uptake transcriptional regulator
MTPNEILEVSQEHCPGLGIATVYRAIKSLVEEGWALPVELPGMPDRFERSGKDHHHHFHCRGCGKVFEVDDCHAEIPKLAPDGFLVEDHEVFLYGRCPACAE